MTLLQFNILTRKKLLGRVFFHYRQEEKKNDEKSHTSHTATARQYPRAESWNGSNLTNFMFTNAIARNIVWLYHNNI